MRESWEDLINHWHVDPIKGGRKFDEIAAAYSGPGRFYHSLDHVLAVLATVESLAPHAKNLNAVKLAAWLHDVIYESKASDNEERSAVFAERLCHELAIPAGNLVAALIRKTKTHDPGEDADAQVLLDADLAILGADETDYKAYAESIRREYAWVPEPEYRKGRRQILEKFLTRPRIYHFLSHLEQPARRNLEAEIARLATNESIFEFDRRLQRCVVRYGVRPLPRSLGRSIQRVYRENGVAIRPSNCQAIGVPEKPGIHGAGAEDQG